MDPTLRRVFNAAYGAETYDRLKRGMQDGCATPDFPFRLAEIPVLFDHALRDRCERAAVEIVEGLSAPRVIFDCTRRIPERFLVPGTDALPHMVAVDLALVRDGDGTIVPRLIECQGFPSLYGMQLVMGDVWGGILAEMPGMPRAWSITLGGLDRERFLELLRRTIVSDADPEEVVLVDIDPPTQKTSPDFAAIERFLGVRSVCITRLERRGNALFAPRGGGRAGTARVRRIFNRVVFDELVSKGIQPPFSWNDALDVTWVPHPNWYWIWSKASMPYLDHPAVPRCRLVSDLTEIPADLSGYVLKPLFSFAGRGVVVDVDRAAIDAIPQAERRDWMLMEKVAYVPALEAPDGAGVKVELRVLFLRPDGESKLVPAIELCRLSRGKMHGVDHNKNLDWVGSSIAIWPA